MTEDDSKEVMIYDWSLVTVQFFIFTVSRKLTIISAAVANASTTSLLAIFIFGARYFLPEALWKEKPALEIRVSFWSRFMVQVSDTSVIYFRTESHRGQLCVYREELYDIGLQTPGCTPLL